MSGIPYEPACMRCRGDAGKERAPTTYVCPGHVAAERNALRAENERLREAIRLWDDAADMNDLTELLDAEALLRDIARDVRARAALAAPQEEK